MAIAPSAPAAKATPETKLLVWSLLGVALIIVLAIGFGLYQSEGRFLLQLQETAVSRGLITFLVAVVTVSLALLVTIWLLASNAGTEELKTRFAYAKDVLATLVGILGTILGFYFGSAERTTTEQLALAEMQFKSGQAIAHVSGGTPPFRYTISWSDGDKGNATKVSKDGWIFEAIPAALNAAGLVTIEVTDSKDRKTSRTTKYQSDEHDQSAATPREQKQSTQSATTPKSSASAASK